MKLYFSAIFFVFGISIPFSARALENIFVIFPPSENTTVSRIISVLPGQDIPPGEYSVSLEGSVPLSFRDWKIIESMPMKVEGLSDAMDEAGWKQDENVFLRPPGEYLKKTDKKNGRNEDVAAISFSPALKGSPDIGNNYNGVIVEYENLHPENPVDLILSMKFSLPSGNLRTVTHALSAQKLTRTNTVAATSSPISPQKFEINIESSNAIKDSLEQIDMNRAIWKPKNYTYILGRELGWRHDNIWRYKIEQETGRVVLQRRLDVDVKTVDMIEIVMDRKTLPDFLYFRIDGQAVPWVNFDRYWYKVGDFYVLGIDISDWISKEKKIEKLEEIALYFDLSAHPVNSDLFPVRFINIWKGVSRNWEGIRKILGGFEDAILYGKKIKKQIEHSEFNDNVIYLKKGVIAQVKFPLELFGLDQGDGKSEKLISARIVPAIRNSKAWSGVRLHSFSVVQKTDLQQPEYLRLGVDITSSMGGLEFPEATLPGEVEWVVPLKYEEMGGIGFPDVMSGTFMVEGVVENAGVAALEKNTVTSCSKSDHPVLDRQLYVLPFKIFESGSFAGEMADFNVPVRAVHWPVSMEPPKGSYIHVSIEDGAESIYMLRIVPFAKGKALAEFMGLPGERISLASLQGRAIDCFSVQFILRSPVGQIGVKNIGVYQIKLLSPKEAYAEKTVQYIERGLLFENLKISKDIYEISKFDSSADEDAVQIKIKTGKLSPIEWDANVGIPLNSGVSLEIPYSISPSLDMYENAALNLTIYGDRGQGKIRIMATQSTGLLTITKKMLLSLSDEIGTRITSIHFSLDLIKFEKKKNSGDVYLSMAVKLKSTKVGNFQDTKLPDTGLEFNGRPLKVDEIDFRDAVGGRFQAKLGIITVEGKGPPDIAKTIKTHDGWKLDQVTFERILPLGLVDWQSFIKEGNDRKKINNENVLDKKKPFSMPLSVYVSGALLIYGVLLWLFIRRPRSSRAHLKSSSEDHNISLSMADVTSFRPKLLLSIFAVLFLYGAEVLIPSNTAVGKLSNINVYTNVAALVWLFIWHYGLMFVRPWVARFGPDREIWIYASGGTRFFAGAVVFLSWSGLMHLIVSERLAHHPALIAFCMLSAGVFVEVRQFLKTAPDVQEN